MIKITTTVSHDSTKSHTIDGLTDAELTALGDLIFRGQRGAHGDLQPLREFADTLINLIEDVEGDAAPTALTALKEAP